MGTLMQGFSSAGGIGLLGSISSGIGSYYGAQAEGIAAEGQYAAMQGQSNAMAIQALTEAGALSNQYKIGAINMIMEAQAQKAEYDLASARYQIEGEGKKGQASIYESEAAIKLLEKAYTMRNASILGVSALDVVRQGAEAEAKLREEGRKFKGTQRTSIAAGGTDVASGNALDILRETEEGIENDSAALRYTAQKNRWELLVQQQNMWMLAEVRDLESKNYTAAAEGMRRSAEMSYSAAEVMKQIGGLAVESGESGSQHYEELARLALQGGQITANNYQAQGQLYGQLGGVAKSAANAKAIGGLLSMAAPAIGTFVGNRQANSAASSFNSDLSWNALGVGMGLDNEIKINEAALGKFMPSKSKKVESYGNGFLYTPKDWGLA